MKLGLATGVAREVGSSYRVLHVKLGLATECCT